MGLSLSLLSWAWVEIVRNKILGSKEVEAVFVRSISFNETDVATALRSVSFNRSDSGIKMAPDSIDEMGIKRSLSFGNWGPSEEIELKVSNQLLKRIPDESKPEHLSCPRMETEAAFQFRPAEHLTPVFSSPRPLSELDAAALKLQKVYKSYRTRRNLADCAVVVEELWWKALDFASLKRSSVSFFNAEKPETAVSRWARARTRVAKVGKGLSKDDKAQKLALQHWLEAIDPRHRYGHNLHLYYDLWFESESTQPFFYWLDVGDGREVNLEKCSRSNLQQQCIKYLGPQERQAYEVIVEDGKLVYKQTEKLVDTVEGSKWIFVLSTSRVLYVGQKKKGTFQHSSFLSGAATSAAGRLVAKEGILQAIWPYSGHYLPTEENFNEFISFLEENNMDLTNVKRCSIDDDEFTSLKKSESEYIKETTKVDVAVTETPDLEERKAEEPPKEYAKPEYDIEKEEAFVFGKRLSCKWTTGTGPRIGCVRDYPTELQFRALEQVNLSPTVIPSPVGNKVPIPSPRPSPKVRLSPRLAYMGFPTTPTVSLTLPKIKKI